MSAFILSKNEIELLTQATAAALQLNRKYKASYTLTPETVDLLGKYADDLHSLYRALYIANIKAVNGRYGDDTKTLPKYTPVKAWDLERLPVDRMEKAAGTFGCYMYQCAEDPVIYSPVWYALQDIRKLLCTVIIDKRIGWGN